MKLPGYRRLLRKDVPDAPDWIASLLNPLNLFLERVTRLFEKGISFDDNIDCKRYAVTVDAHTGLIVPLNGRRCRGVIITRVFPAEALTPTWQVEGDSLRLGPWTGVTAGTYELEFIVFS
jgi:hypothetical protein